MHMPLVLTNRRRRGGSASAPAFSPTSLYSSGSQGIWLDPSDLSTMFSDRAGTTPVTTPGTVVGLRLDKSKGLALGAELWTNTGVIGMSATIAANGAGWNVTSTGTSFVGIRLNTASLGTSSYKSTVSWSGNVNGRSIGLLVGGGSTILGTAVSGSVTLVHPSTGVSASIQLYAVSASIGETFTFTVSSVRELAGNHAQAPTDAARPIYGVEPKGGRRNLLTFSEQFDNAAWSKAAGTVVTANQVVAPDGTTTADLVVGNGTNGLFSQAITVPSNSQNTKSVWLRGVSGGETVILKDSTQTVSTVTCTLTTSWQRFTLTETQTGTTLGLWVDDIPAGGIFIWGAQLELGSTATNYQRVTNDYDVTEAGVVSCHYCRYDGSDDSMSTAAIDFTATDKMSVFAGVRKLSDAAMGAALGLSTNPPATAGAIELLGPAAAAANDYRWTVRGTSTSTMNPAGFVAPVSNVLTGIADISGDLATLRANGAVAATSASDLGTGNFGNYPLFIGRRNNATLPFNGKDYGIVIVGKAASAGEITDTETWLAAKTAQVTL